MIVTRRVIREFEYICEYEMNIIYIFIIITINTRMNHIIIILMIVNSSWNRIHITEIRVDRNIYIYTYNSYI
jgi:hypothetical protein